MQIDAANQKEEIVCKTDRQAIVRIGLAAELNESVVNAFSNARVLCYELHSTYKGTLGTSNLYGSRKVQQSPNRIVYRIYCP